MASSYSLLLSFFFSLFVFCVAHVIIIRMILSSSGMLEIISLSEADSYQLMWNRGIILVEKGKKKKVFSARVSSVIVNALSRPHQRCSSFYDPSQTTCWTDTICYTFSKARSFSFYTVNAPAALYTTGTLGVFYKAQSSVKPILMVTKGCVASTRESNQNTPSIVSRAM